MKSCTAYTGDITVDGDIDELWNYVEWIPVTNLKAGDWVDDTSITPADYAALNCKVMWNGADTLYILFDVKDKVVTTSQPVDTWRMDSVEFYVDEDNSREGTIQDDASQTRILAEAGEASSDHWVSAAKLTDTGYVVEVAYKYFNVAVKDGTVSGFDLQVNDDANDDGNREACLGWCDVDDSASGSNEKWGEIKFSSTTVESFIPVAEEAAEAAEEAAPVTDESAAPAQTAAQTSDTASAFAVLALVSASAYIAVKKFRSSN
ncbi:MAG: sugar-binding protein [Eubacteriales bacterium]